MIRYFAYGQNTNEAEFYRRIPPAILVGKAYLPNYALVLREFADIVPKKSEKVWGVLWDVPAGWISELDEIEELYRQKSVFVHWNGSRTKAMVYVMTSPEKGFPSKHYVQRLVEGYTKHKLPISQLKKAFEP
jgi:gamma-glutamylcyclotransferase (GGCT)/AIG2-like uncharacterized protein YtfP